MNILRKNNLNDPYNYLPDNVTVGTFAYYKRKFGDKLPDWQYHRMEALAKLEGAEQEETLNQINEYVKSYNNRLLEEIYDRQNENILDNNDIEHVENNLSDNRQQTDIC